MKRNAVLVDVSIDQGGCFETSRPTTHTDPTYEVDGVTHYCVANMPGAVPITSTCALTNATMPYVAPSRRRGRRAAPRARTPGWRRAQRRRRQGHLPARSPRPPASPTRSSSRRWARPAARPGTRLRRARCPSPRPVLPARSRRARSCSACCSSRTTTATPCSSRSCSPTAGAPVDLRRADRSPRRARRGRARVDCVLLDLGLPDAQGLDGCARCASDARRRRRLVLTGLDDERRGVERGRRRAPRTTWSRARSTAAAGPLDPLRGRAPAGRRSRSRQLLRGASCTRSENARLERGLLPPPLLRDRGVELRRPLPAGPQRARCSAATSTTPSRLADGTCTRDRRRLRATAPTRPRSASACASPGARWCWPACAPTTCCATLEQVLVRRAPRAGVFATLCDGRDRARPRGAGCALAGHPPPLLLAGAGAGRRCRERGRAAARRRRRRRRWPASEVELPRGWSLLLYTDGLIEGRVGGGADAAGRATAWSSCSAPRGAARRPPAALLDALVDRAEALNGGAARRRRGRAAGRPDGDA